MSISSSAFTLTIANTTSEGTTGWNGNTVVFDYDVSCSAYLSKVFSAIDVAANTWGNVRTSALRVQIGSGVTLPLPITTYVGAGATSYAPIRNTIIYCDTAFAANSGQDANSIPGFAGAQNYDGEGHLQGALLVLNVQAGAGANITSYNSVLLSTILIHEIGHCLGIGHSSDPEAIMYYQGGLGRVPELAKDDMDAVTYLYPQKDSGTNFLGCSSVAAVTGSNWGGSGAKHFWKAIGPDLALLFLVLALIRLFSKTYKRKPI